MTVDETLLVKLTEANAIGGNEGQVRSIFKEATKAVAEDGSLTVSSLKKSY